MSAEPLSWHQIDHCCPSRDTRRSWNHRVQTDPGSGRQSVEMGSASSDVCSSPSVARPGGFYSPTVPRPRAWPRSSPYPAASAGAFSRGKPPLLTAAFSSVRLPVVAFLVIGASSSFVSWRSVSTFSLSHSERHMSRLVPLPWAVFVCCTCGALPLILVTAAKKRRKANRGPRTFLDRASIIPLYMCSLVPPSSDIMLGGFLGPIPSARSSSACRCSSWVAPRRPPPREVP